MVLLTRQADVHQASVPESRQVGSLPEPALAILQLQVSATNVGLPGNNAN